jgi:hypothetical protein
VTDFTKEELEQLRDGLAGWMEFSGIINETPWLNKLIIKAQTMIDNYCEYEFIGYLEGTARIPYCNKCRSAIYDNK